MAKKESINEDISDVKKEIASKNVLIGTDITIKNIRNKSVKKVYISSNCDKVTEEKVMKYCDLTKTPVQKLTQTNLQLGTICRKPFSISVLGIPR